MSETPPSRHRLVERRLAAANAKYEVFFDRVEGPDGSVPNYLMVRPKARHAGGVSGVCVLPEVDGRIGLMQARRPQFAEPIWVAPSGFVEPGEPTEVSALRELQEEAGLTCDPRDLRPLGLLLLDPGVLEARVALFVASPARPLPAGVGIVGIVGGGEIGVGELTFFAPGALEELAVTSPHMDGGTVVACLRYLAGRR